MLEQHRSLKYERHHHQNDANEADDTQQDEKAAVAMNNKEADIRFDARKANTNISLVATNTIIE